MKHEISITGFMAWLFNQYEITIKL